MRRRCWLLFVWLLVVSAVSAADLPQSKREVEAEVQRARAEVTQRIEQVQRSLAQSDTDEAAKKSPEADDELRLLNRWASVLAQHAARLQQLRDTKALNQEADEIVKHLKESQPPEKPPYSFLLVDRLRDQSELAEQAEATLKAEVEAAKRLVAIAADELRARETELRGDRQSVPRQEEVKVGTARLALRRTEHELKQVQLDLNRQQQKQLDARIAALKHNVTFSVADRDQQLEQLAEQTAELMGRRHFCELRLEKIVRQLEELPPETARHGADPWKAKSLQHAAECFQTELALIDQSLGLVGELSELWRHRFDLATKAGADIEQARTWKYQVGQFLDHIEAQREILRHHRQGLHNVPNSVAAQDESEPVAVTAREASRHLDEFCAVRLEQFPAWQLPMERFQGELKRHIARTASWWNVGWRESLKRIFAYEVIEVEDESITITQVVLLVLLIVAAIYFSFWASRWTGRYVIPRLGLKPGVAAALKSIFRYSFVIAAGILAFRIMHVPIAAFAFLGGAAAIAAGFASKDIMNNFMSGVILLTEQPIRVGDVVIFNDVQCLVIQIGLRSTRLRNYQNYELVVPNTVLIDRMVVNLTLSNNRVRLFVTLEVDRTEPIQESIIKILEAVKAQTRVISDAPPTVILKQCDTYYLVFDVYFSIELVNPLQSLLAQSQVLEAIGRLFPTPREPEAKASASDAAQAEVSAGALNHTQVEREIKRLQAILATK